MLELRIAQSDGQSADAEIWRRRNEHFIPAFSQRVENWHGTAGVGAGSLGCGDSQLHLKVTCRGGGGGHYLHGQIPLGDANDAPRYGPRVQGYLCQMRDEE